MILLQFGITNFDGLRVVGVEKPGGGRAGEPLDSHQGE